MLRFLEGPGCFFVMRVSVMSLIALHAALGIPMRERLPEAFLERS